MPELRENMYRLLLAMKLDSKRKRFVTHISPRFCQLLVQLYQQFDVFVERHNSEKNRRVSCHPGCGRCCTHFVDSVFAFEILYLSDILGQRSDFHQLLDACQTRVRKLSAISNIPIESQTSRNEDEVIFQLEKYAQLNIPCPFLENNYCGIYEFRPFSCRSYFSLSDPNIAIRT